MCSTHPDRARWDRRYADRPPPGALRPPQWLLECLDRLQLAPGRALDVACGEGHVAVELARRGWEVEAFDVSMEALRRAQRLAERHGVRVGWFSADATRYPLPRARYDLITVFLYLDRDVLPRVIPEALKVGGALVYETFTLEACGWPGFRVTNPRHLLEPNELFALYADRLRVYAYADLSDRERPVQRLLAMRC